MSLPAMFTAEKTAKVIIISPALAANWLQFNTRNRPLNKNRVERYINKIERGLWQYNGQTIIWNTSGGLNDGQHRLEACVKSGQPIESVVAWGADPLAIITTDRGQSRNLRQNITLIQGKKSKDIGRVANMSIAWFVLGEREKAFRTHKSVEFEDALEYIEENPEMENFNLYENDATARRIAVPSTLWFCHYVCAEIDGTDADYFFGKLISGRIGDNPNDETILQLREQLMSNRGERGYTQDVQAALIFIAWNLFRKGETRKIIKWAKRGASAQAFPEPI